MNKFQSPKVIMITGAAGYIGGMLCDQFSRSPDIEQIIAVDKLPMPELLKDNKKIIWITANLYQSVWKIPALINKPEVLIHCAWQTAELYNNEDLQKKLNIDSSRAVFEFAFSSRFVKKLIFFSDVSVYGALSPDGTQHYFSESDEPGEDELLSGVQKKEAEEILRDLYNKSDKEKQVFVFRPSQIVGPRAHLLNSFKRDLYGMTSQSLPFMPIGSNELSRQYVHEDDVIDATAMFTFSEIKSGGTYEVYNISPNDLVATTDVARLAEKKVIKLPPALFKALFYILWNLTSGRIPAGRGEWKSFCYNTLVDGSKITKKYGFSYTYTSNESYSSKDGRYEQIG